MRGNNTIITDILLELRAAKRKQPTWPDHIVARAAMVAEEAGELLRASLQYKYEPLLFLDNEGMRAEMRKEAIQTAAMCLRFIEALDKDKL
ncbi:hypothetical protein EGT74_24355 [Chitinophaga lutea]|uniref:Uncharacterized protein n=1 Tax=Chitinophaga lutea TaxID=2488634 RepID=A0A3N4PP61_9BACT|nr:hypothetical protein [Chitinophaga lutea]RPE05520.1 hypothetical protein EGT74_24355 [Chitinophaga lutea]